MTSFRNAEEAFQALVRSIKDEGELVSVRGSVTREITSQTVVLERIRERCLLVPGRRNNIFASIAETMWVVAGRNDVQYLDGYLKRAYDFSDDGETWRAGYGPRLRDWNGIDQLEEVVRILREDTHSRRAVISLFDPDRDFGISKDIPCNNWLHFMVRGGKLQLHVAARSTDLWWGFSGINTFEWSVLLEMVAHWVGVVPGALTFFSSSIHVYERHFSQSDEIVKGPTVSSYERHVRLAEFKTDWDRFDAEIQQWMKLESQIRNGVLLAALSVEVNDPLMRDYLRMIDIFWRHRRGTSISELVEATHHLRGEDLAVAAQEYLTRD